MEFDPRIVGVLEYQGDLLIKIGKLDKERANFAQLGRVFWPLSDEESQLRQASAAVAIN